MSHIRNSKTCNSRSFSEETVKPGKSTKVSGKPRMICDEAEYELFQKLIRQRLIECGWSDQIKLLCKDVIREKGSQLTVTQLLEEVSLKARNLLPMSIKKELLQKVKDHIQKKKNESKTPKHK